MGRGRKCMGSPAALQKKRASTTWKCDNGVRSAITFFFSFLYLFLMPSQHAGIHMKRDVSIFCWLKNFIWLWLLSELSWDAVKGASPVWKMLQVFVVHLCGCCVRVCVCVSFFLNWLVSFLITSNLPYVQFLWTSSRTGRRPWPCSPVPPMFP